MRFDPLRERLLKGGIAPRHVRRYLGELEDHLAELTRCEEDAGYDPADAASRARAALGDDAQLADAMLKQRDFRSISARAPWLVFILATPFAAMFAFLIPTLTLVIIGKTHGMIMHSTSAAPAWFQWLAVILTSASNLLLPALLSTLLVRIAMAQRLPNRWPLIGIAVIAMFGLHMAYQFPLPGHRGSISVGSLLLAGRRDLPELFRDWPLLLTQLLFTLSPLAWLKFAKQPGRI